MATANFTGKETEQTLAQLACSAGLTAGIHGQLTFISGINIFLSITAFLGNVLILAALRKESSLHPPSKLLLRSLAATDLCVGVIAEPFYVGYLMSVVNEHWDVCRSLLVAALIQSTILCGVSLYTLAAISVDRLLALLLGLRYKQVVTLKRAFVIVITLWVVLSVFSTMYLLERLITIWCIIISISVCLLTSIFSYTTIFLKLRHRQNEVQDQARQQNQANQLNIARYRKAVYSALWLQLTLVACYLPGSIIAPLATTAGLSSDAFLARQYATTLVFLNSSLNPILYFWKVGEVRQAVKDTIRQVLCCLSS